MQNTNFRHIYRLIRSRFKRSGKKASCHGYTLLELSLVLGVLGLLSGSLLSLGARHSDQTALSQAQARLNAIDDALARYYRTHGTLPCPAALTLPEDQPAFGRATSACDSAAAPGTARALPASGTEGRDNVASGAVPVRSLGLPDTFMYDPWGNRIHYALIARLATQPIESFTTTLTSGVMQITDATGAQINPASTDVFVPYALWSPGPDKRGAYSRAGVPAGPACGGTRDSENCTNDAVFRDADINDASTPANFYFDILKWNTNRLILAKTSEQVELARQPSLTPLPTGPVGMVSTWYTTTCFLNSQGEVYCWGSNYDNRVGDGTSPNGSNVDPGNKVAGGFTDWTNISANYFTTCGVRAGGLGYCWGNNSYGQLGDGTYTNRAVPTLPVAGISNFKEIVTSVWGACGRTIPGKLYCWGHNWDNEGFFYGNSYSFDPSYPALPSPVAAGDPSWNWTDIDVDGFICGVRDNGEAYCWGTNGIGQVGNDAMGIDATTPSLVEGGFTDWKEVNVDYFHACGVRTNGRGYCWGWNDDAQLGIGSVGGPESGWASADAGTGYDTPQEVGGGGISSWSTIEAGDKYSCGIANGTAYCWGRNFVGLGTPGLPGSEVSNPTPVTTPINDWVDLHIRSSHTCAIRANGELWCWGDDSNGQLGNGAPYANEDVPKKVTGVPF